jgi:hypothetical protein
MEREAYTKGNLIFRDFEDLIKTGKVTIDIDFKKSGEPKMSLKEWKNNELNMLMMKKWGLLKEAAAIEENCPHAEEGGEALDVSAPGMEVHVDDISQLAPEEAFGAGIAAARDAIDQLIGTDDQDAAPEGEFEEVEEIQEGGMRYRGEDEPEEGGWGKTHRHDDPLAALSGEDYEGIEDPEVADIEGDQFGMGDKFKAGGAMGGAPAKEKLRRGPRARRSRSTGPGMALGPRFEGTDKKMISVKEAKRLTQQIIERYLAEKK